MSTDRLAALLDTANKQDQQELKVAHNAMIASLKAHGTAPTASTVANKNATREDFEATLTRLEAKYYPETQPAPEGERFANRKQALNWLQAQGYKVSQGKFYQDCEAGFPMLQRDGTVSRYQVMQYGQQQDLATRALPQFDQSARREALEIRKLEAEVAEKEQKARKEDSRWMLKEDAWAAIAAILSTLQDNLRHYVHEGQALLVYKAGGPPDRGPEIYEAVLELTGKALDELGGARIEGLFEDAAAMLDADCEVPDDEQ